MTVYVLDYLVPCYRHWRDYTHSVELHTFLGNVKIDIFPQNYDDARHYFRRGQYLKGTCEVFIPFKFKRSTCWAYDMEDSTDFIDCSCDEGKTTISVPDLNLESAYRFEIEIEDPVIPKPKPKNSPPPIELDLLRLLQSGAMADVWFLVEEEKIPAHRAILTARCPYFELMFRSAMMETKSSNVPIGDVSAEAFKVILYFLYGGCLLTDQNAVLAPDVLPKAHEYGLSALVEDCASRMEPLIGIDNVCMCYLKSVLFNCQLLTEKCASFMKANASAVKKTRGWILLGRQSPDIFMSLLSALLD